MEKVIINKRNDVGKEFFLDYINFLEGTKTLCKAMHWGIANIEISNKRGAHIYLDNFFKEISDYQDTIAEITQGILGNYITIDDVYGKKIRLIKNTPQELLAVLLENVINFNNKIDDNLYIGIKSETESFIKDIQQYNYLFSLC